MDAASKALIDALGGGTKSVFATTQFKGIVPRVTDSLLSKEYATVAHDVDLSRGTLAPFRTPKFIKSTPPNTLRIHEYDCYIYDFPMCVDVAEWMPDCKRLYITGRKEYPEVAIVGQGGELVYQRAGVPIPQGSPSVQRIGAVVDNYSREETEWVYTFVNNLGEEGGPSMPSKSLAINDSHTVLVSGFETPAPEWAVTGVRIYRRASGLDTGGDKVIPSITDFFLVAEIPIGTAVYTDTSRIEALGEMLYTREVRPPPAGLQNITAVPDTGIMVGSLYNKLYFSINRQPWNYPQAQEITLDDNIIDMHAIGNSLYVLTDGHPYTITATSSCESRECRQVNRIDTPAPLIACGSGKGSVATPYGVVYASTDGLMLLVGDKLSLLTGPFLTSTQWRQTRPETTRLGYAEGRLFCTTDIWTFMMFIDTNIYTYEKKEWLVTLSMQPHDYHTSRSGQLYVLLDDGVYVWDAGTSYMPYIWESASFSNNTGAQPSVVKVKLLNGETSVTIGGHTIRAVESCNGLFRIPRLPRNCKYRIKLTGIGEVELAALGTSFRALDK